MSKRVPRGTCALAPCVLDLAIRGHTASGGNESLADAFAYYVTWKDSESRMRSFWTRMPRTYEYLSGLGANGWRPA